MKVPLYEIVRVSYKDFSRDRSQLFASRYVFLSGRALNATPKKVCVVAYDVAGA